MVNGSLYDNFDSYPSIDELNRQKWSSNSNTVVISNGAILTQVSNSIGRGDSGIQFAAPNEINSIEADITVTSISNSNSPRARIAGTWFNTGKADVYAMVSVYRNKVTFGVSEQWFGDQNTWRWRDLAVGDLLTGIVPGQTIRCRIALNGSTLSFSANGATNQYTFPGTVYPPSGPDKNLASRINLTTSVTPTFTWDPVPDAVQYRVRVYNHDNSETIWRGYTEGAGNLLHGSPRHFQDQLVLPLPDRCLRRQKPE